MSPISTEFWRFLSWNLHPSPLSAPSLTPPGPDAKKVDLEYKLATGQLDNPAELTLAASNASNAALLLMELRNKALDVYNELMRVSL